MNKQWVYIISVCLIATVVFFVSNHGLAGYLRAPKFLAKEIKTPVDSLEQYRLSHEAPFKYRVLFPAIVKGSYHFIFQQPNTVGFFYIYKFWSWLFYATSACALFFLLSVCGFSKHLSFIGVIIFLLMPPMLMAYTLPVHTREDVLGYTIFFIGLIFLLKKKWWGFFLSALAGVLCRETLLLLPLLYFFFSDDKNLIRRLAIAGIPGILFLSLRWIMGFEDYDVWEGLKWNLKNTEQVIGFLLISFNVGWITLFFHFTYAEGNVVENSAKHFFYRTLVFTLSVILLTTYFGGIYNEIRLLYLFSPWIIIVFLDFLEKYGSHIRQVFQSMSYWLFAFSAMFVCGLLLYLMLNFRESLIVPSRYAPYHRLWIIFSACYVFIVLLFIPVTLKYFSLKKSDS